MEANCLCMTSIFAFEVELQLSGRIMSFFWLTGESLLYIWTLNLLSFFDYEFPSSSEVEY